MKQQGIITPQQIKIRGLGNNGDRISLDEVIEGIILLRDLIEENKYHYRVAWKTWLPPVDGEIPDDGFGRISYIPIASKRKSLDEEFVGRVKDAPYWVFMLNQARESRPKSQDKKKQEEPSHCKLCKNVTGKNMILSEVDDFYLTPNGFPYDFYSSLLIKKGTEHKQGDISPQDIATWMKTSILLDQFVFYNSPGAGASILEHQHAQMVDPSEIMMENQVVPFPMFNKSHVGRESVNSRPDVFRIKGYSIDALIFTGRDAPTHAYAAVDALKTDDRAYNVLVNKNEVYVVGRNKENQRSICIRRNVGALEICGVFLLGDVEEASGGYLIKMNGSKVFTAMNYEIAGKNAIRASVRLDSIARKF